MENQITFNIGDENRIVVEKLENKKDIENSIFSDVYSRLLLDLNKYCSSIDTHKIPDEEDSLNNIFAFIGERGSGKTSCMKSLAKLLENSSEIKNEFSSLKVTRFYCLDTIDPSFIDNDTNLIGIILANLYKRFMEYDNNRFGRNFQKDFPKRNNLIEMFSDTQRNYLRVMKNNEAKPQNIDFDGLELLSSLSSAIDLKKDIFNLVNCFLEYVGDDKSMLVVSIDDIDLNSQSATNMVEQVRKYLELPNILILFSVKLDQLYQLKRRELVKQNYDAYNTVSLTEIDEMVEKYLTKLIPNNHRFYMPEGTYYWNKELVIKDNEYEYKYPSVRQAVPTLIFQKVRFLFYNSTVKTSLIVPDNLRDLRQLIRLLYDMQKPEEDKQDLKNGERKLERKNFQRNKSTFIKYIVETWMPSHLSSEARSLISDWLNVNDPIQMNASALKTLRLEFKEETANILNEGIESKDNDKSDDKTRDDINELRMILDSRNMIYNISIGDVLAVIDYLERLDISYEKSCFLFMMKTMYSITLFECYDVYTAQLDHLESKKVGDTSQDTTPNDNMGNDDLEVETVLKRSLFEDTKLPEYFKLLGGRLFNTQLNVILPRSDKTKIYRSARIINNKALNELIEKCCGDDASTDEIMMAEFFMLCTARTINRRNYKTKSANYNEPDFRTNRSLAYTGRITASSNPYFDLSAFLYNVLTYEQCIRRFTKGNDFLEKIKQLESGPHPIAASQSLHSAFRYYTGTNMRTDKSGDYKRNITSNPIEYNYVKTGDTKHRWTSWAGIRNYEVLSDLISFLDEKEYRNEGDDINVLMAFFHNLASYNINSYDLRRTDDDPTLSENYHSINFRFAWVVSNLLNNIAHDDSLKKTFDEIYNGFEGNENVSNNTPLIMDVLRFPENQFKPKYNYSLCKTINKRIKKKHPIFQSGQQGTFLDEVFPPNSTEQINQDEFTTKYNKLMSRLETFVNGTTPSDN